MIRYDASSAPPKSNISKRNEIKESQKAANATTTIADALARSKKTLSTPQQ
jgi:hypothetical protein